jgi:hypothetical protein
MLDTLEAGFCYTVGRWKQRWVKMKHSNKSLYDHTRRIRDLINNPRKRHMLLKNRPLWEQLCSSLDVIEDSDLAIAAYSKRKLMKEAGTKYLAIYGLLQALFLQQDAIRNLCESLGIPMSIENYPTLQEVRKIRNDSIGHPTKRGRETKKGRKKEVQLISYHHISRPTLSPKGFQLVSYYSNGKSEFKYISVLDLIADQKKYASEILSTIIDKLEQEEKAHKEKFRMEKLTPVFAPLDYAFQKLYEVLGTNQIPHPVYGEPNLQQIKKTLYTTFKNALEKRGIELETYDSIKFLYEELEYPLNELEKFFRNAKEDKTLNINKETAKIFVFFVEKQIDELKEIAEEMDKEYSNSE